jgi:hypothetical protein
MAAYGWGGVGCRRLISVTLTPLHRTVGRVEDLKCWVDRSLPPPGDRTSGASQYLGRPEPPTYGDKTPGD